MYRDSSDTVKSIHKSLPLIKNEYSTSIRREENLHREARCMEGGGSQMALDAGLYLFGSCFNLIVIIHVFFGQLPIPA